MKVNIFNNLYATLVHNGFTDEVLCRGYLFINLTTRQATKIFKLAQKMNCAWVDENTGLWHFGNENISYIYLGGE